MSRILLAILILFMLLCGAAQGMVVVMEGSGAESDEPWNIKYLDGSRKVRGGAGYALIGLVLASAVLSRISEKEEEFDYSLDVFDRLALFFQRWKTRGSMP